MIHRGMFDSAQEIKDAVDAGNNVYWANMAYRVISDNLGQYFIVCSLNDNAIGLTWMDGVTLNGWLIDFFIVE